MSRFNLLTYSDWLKKGKSAGYTFIGFDKAKTILSDTKKRKDFLKKPEKRECNRKKNMGYCLLRHDVDADLNAAVKMAQVEKHLIDRRIYDWEGCYCFMNSEKYLYIGETKHSLGRRMLIEHKNKIFWHEADSIRILIPGDKRNTKKLERLLILNYMPTVNDSDGVQSSSADEVLEILGTEMDELARP